MTDYYIACNPYEGCGHRHKTRQAAEACLPRIEKRGKVRVQKMDARTNKKETKRNDEE